MTRVAIQHCSWAEGRPEHVAGVVEQLEGWAGVVTVVDDVERRGPAWSWRECLATAGDERLLMLQDDVAVLCPGEVIDEVADLRPDQLLCLCAPRYQTVEARDRGLAWLEVPGTVWTYGVVYPPGLASDVLRWCVKNVPEEYPHDDRSLGAYMLAHGLSAYIPIPGLVQHLDGEFRSTMGHGGGKKSRRGPTEWEPGARYDNLNSAVLGGVAVTSVDEIIEDVFKRMEQRAR